MGYSDFGQSLSKAGYGVKVNKQPLTSNTLMDAKLLVLAGPMSEFNEEEIKSITGFVNSGGNLLILTHIAQPLIPLTEKFDIQPSLAVVCEAVNPIDNSPQDFYVADFEDHPITAHIKKLAVFGTWGLRTREGSSARVVARTSKEAWADLNKDQNLNKGEPQEAYGIVAISQYGDGKAVICADDAILINKFLKEDDNLEFGENLISWFESRTI
jgi:hypothetical protein